MTEPVLRPAPDVAYVVDDTQDELRVYLAKVPLGPPLVMDEAAAVIWEEVVEGGTRAEIAARVAQSVDEAPGRVAADVDAFLDELSVQGLIVSG